MEHVERAGNWPGEHNFMRAACVLICQQAVWARLNPGTYLCFHAGPEKPESDAVQSFVITHVARRGGGVVRAEDEAAQSGRGDKDEQRSIVIDGLEDGEPILVDKELVLADEVVVTTVDAGEG
jgi:hypothetical protein